MSQRPQSSGKSQDDHGDDLTTILDPTQRADLTILVAQCTESMRKIICNNFDAKAGLDQSLIQKATSEEEKMMEADPKADVEKYDKERKLQEECEKDVASTKMQNLKTSTLASFDEWREQVLTRIGEVVNSANTARDQLKKTTPVSPRPHAPATMGKIEEVPPHSPAKLKFKDLFPPTKTALTKLSMEQRTLILHAVLLLLISLEHYTAWSRVLMLNMTASLKLPLKTFEQDEYTTAKGLLEAAREMSANEETKKKQDQNKDNRKWKVGLATVAGAAVIGVTGGLAAPLVAAGVGSVMGGLGLGATAAAGYLGTVAGSTIVVGSLFGAYGGRMTGQMMDQYAREVEDFEFLPVHSNNKTSEDYQKGAEEASEHDHKLRVTICISGWLTQKEEVVKPWRVLGVGAEVFALKFELEALLNLGNAMDGMLKSAAWGMAQKEIVSRTIFADLMAAFWPLALLKVARAIDNPFSVAKSRADKAGEVLADALINRAQGERPVTLIGYSLGARVIYTCLKSLADRKAFGLIENAVIIGAPMPSDMTDWRMLRTVVSGRLVNVYSENDYLLGFMYRASALQYGVAGLQKIEGVAGIENVNVSEDIDGHNRYRYLVGGILKRIGFEDIDLDAVAEEREQLDKMLEQEKQQSLEAQRKRLLRRESNQGKVSEEEEAEEEAKEMEKNVKQATEKSMMTKVTEYFYAPKQPNNKDAEKAAQNLQKNGGKVSQDSTQSYTQYVTSKLPSMPGRTSSAGQKKDTANQNSETATGTASKYMKQAQGYLPKSMPSMPSFGRSERKQSSQQPGAIKQAVETGQAGVTGTSGVVKDTVQPTVNNTLNPKDNPAVKAAKNTTKNAPIIHQASDRIPGANKAAETTSSTVGTTVQNTTSTVNSALNTTTSKAGGAGKAVNGKDNSQGYLSRAAGYMPSAPSMPSMPSFGSGRNKPPKLEKRNSGAQTPTSQSSSGVRSPPPKLDSQKGEQRRSLSGAADAVRGKLPFGR